MNPITILGSTFNYVCRKVHLTSEPPSSDPFHSRFSQVPKDVLNLIFEKLDSQHILILMESYDEKPTPYFFNHAVWAAAKDHDLFPRSMNSFKDMDKDLNFQKILYRYRKNDPIVENLITRIENLRHSSPIPYILRFMQCSIAIDTLVYMKKLIHQNPDSNFYEIYDQMERSRIDQEHLFLTVKEMTEQLEAYETYQDHFLFLGHKSLNSLPFQPKLYSELTTLYLDNNNLVYFPTSLLALKKLTHLYISDNKIPYLPEKIDALSSLKCLDLAINRLTTLPESIGNLEHLESIHLTQNRIKYLPKTLKKLRFLRVLSLDDNDKLKISKKILPVVQRSLDDRVSRHR